MYIFDTIYNNCKNIIGFRQGNINEPQIDSALTISESGIYFQDGHSLCTLTNLKDALEYTDNYPYVAFNMLTTYSIGEIVLTNSKTYVSIVDNNIGNIPGASPTYWVVYDAFSELLENEKRRSLVSVITELFKNSYFQRLGNNILSNKVLYNGVGRLNDTIENNSNIVGYEIVLMPDTSLLCKIESIGVQLTENQTLTVYLFHSSQKTPLLQKEIIYTGGGSMQWFSYSDLLLPYISDIVDSGNYYLVYSQNELTGKAINKNINLNNDCYVCNTYSVISKLASISPFRNHTTNTSELFDINYNEYVGNNNFGINLKLSFYCDYTDFIVSQKHILQELILTQFIFNFFETILLNANNRVNRGQQALSYNINHIGLLLMGVEGKGGLKQKLESLYKSTQIDMSGLSRICKPCSNKYIRFTH